MLLNSLWWKRYKAITNSFIHSKSIPKNHIMLPTDFGPIICFWNLQKAWCGASGFPWSESHFTSGTAYYLFPNQDNLWKLCWFKFRIDGFFISLGQGGLIFFFFLNLYIEGPIPLNNIIYQIYGYDNELSNLRITDLKYENFQIYVWFQIWWITNIICYSAT